jgi:isocitrate lyase
MTGFEDLVPSAAAGRFDGVERPYSRDEVLRLRGSFPIAQTLAERGANRLWKLLHEEPYINALGAMTGGQAMQMVRAGLKAIYLSGWQVAADANTAGAMYPRASIQPTPRPSCASASIRLCSAPIRSSMPRAAQNATGSPPSSPMPRPALAGR